jgi:hypothetical protein
MAQVLAHRPWAPGPRVEVNFPLYPDLKDHAGAKCFATVWGMGHAPWARTWALSPLAHGPWRHGPWAHGPWAHGP